jgi:hypothetical protein
MGANLTLSTGQEIAVSVAKLTVKEWREFISPTGPATRDDEIVSKCTGLEVEELTALPYLDYRAIVAKIVKLAREPLADPNSVSASTLQ